MTKRLTIRTMLATTLVGGCVFALGLVNAATRPAASATEHRSTVPAVSAAKKASNDDLARRYRRVVRRRTVVII